MLNYLIVCADLEIEFRVAAAASVTYLQCWGEEIVLRHDVDKEVGRDFSQLVVQHGDESQVELFSLSHGLLGATQQCEEALPVLEAFVDVTEDETDEGKLQLSWKLERKQVAFRVFQGMKMHSDDLNSS